MLLPYPLRIRFLAVFDRVVDKSKVRASACNSCTHSCGEEFTAALGFPISGSSRILRDSETEHPTKIRPRRYVPHPPRKSLGKLRSVTDPEDGILDIPSHEPRRKQDASVSRFSRPRRHQHHQPWCLAPFNR